MHAAAHRLRQCSRKQHTFVVADRRSNAPQNSVQHNRMRIASASIADGRIELFTRQPDRDRFRKAAISLFGLLPSALLR
jgi:hypothetical protein